MSSQNAIIREYKWAILVHPINLQEVKVVLRSLDPNQWITFAEHGFPGINSIRKGSEPIEVDKGKIDRWFSRIEGI